MYRYQGAEVAVDRTHFTLTRRRSGGTGADEWNPQGEINRGRPGEEQLRPKAGEAGKHWREVKVFTAKSVRWLHMLRQGILRQQYISKVFYQTTITNRYFKQ